MNRSELSRMAGAIDDSTINIVVVIIIIIIKAKKRTGAKAGVDAAQPHNTNSCDQHLYIHGKSKETDCTDILQFLCDYHCIVVRLRASELDMAPFFQIQSFHQLMDPIKSNL